MAETQEKETTENELLLQTLRRMPATKATRILMEQMRRGLISQIRAIDVYLEDLPKY